MFDINAIVNTAIATAVQEAIKPLVNQIGCLEADLARATERITALENNPAQGVEVGAANVQRELDDEIMGIKQRLGALEDKDEKVLTSDDVEAIVERWLDDHCSTYDHEDYDRAVAAIDEVDLADVVTTDNLNDAINEALSGATVSISV